MTHIVPSNDLFEVGGEMPKFQQRSFLVLLLWFSDHAGLFTLSLGGATSIFDVH